MTDQTLNLCPTCGIDLDYPTGPHILDCPVPTAEPPLNSMTDPAPSTEDVLDAVIDYGDERSNYATATPFPSVPNVERVRTILAAHDREVAAKAWDEGAQAGWEHSTPEVNGTRYHWRHEGEPRNPYRIGAGDDA